MSVRIAGVVLLQYDTNCFLKFEDFKDRTREYFSQHVHVPESRASTERELIYALSFMHG